MKKMIMPLLVVVMVIVAGCESEHIAKGHKIFNRYCTPCHGEAGDGSGYNANNLDPLPRDLTDSEEEYMVKLDNEEIYEVLQVGGYGVDLSAAMPVWGKVFSEEDLWSLVAYIRTLHPYEGEKIVFKKPESEEPVFNRQKPRYPKVREQVFNDLMASMVPDDGAFEEQVALGEEIFVERGCNACHVVNGEGGELGPDLTRAGFMLQTQYIFRWILNPQSFQSKTRMANLDLPEEDALAIALYVSTLGTTSSEIVTDSQGNREDEGI